MSPKELTTRKFRREPIAPKLGKGDRFGYFEEPLHKLMSKEEADALLKVDKSIEGFVKYATQSEKVCMALTNTDLKV